MAPNLSWGGFSNGRIPYANLVEFQPGKYLQADAAVRLRSLATAFRNRWGANLYADSYQDLYRDYQRQTDMWNNRNAGWPWPSNVASPGNSVHGWARSADLTGYGSGGSDRHNWLVANAPNYGWSWAYGKSLGESWHFDYVGPITTTAGGGSQQFEQEVEMAAIAYIFDGSGTGGSSNPLYGSTGIYVAGLGFKRTSTGTGDRSAYNNFKVYLGAMGVTVTEQHNDVNVLNWAEANLPPLTASAAGFTASDRDTLLDLPTKSELGQALNSAVTLVNEHGDGNTEEIISAMPSGGNGTAPYALTLNIDSVPGTATGTATPE